MIHKPPKVKKFFAFLLIALSFSFGESPLFVLAEEITQSGGTSQLFLVSAYYSPLPNQEAYVRGSYENDIALNGKGIAGADGTAVYVGMLAAPASYPFGTKIFLPGLGVGTVHDRGGAILELGEVHRIDVWMGYGDEGRIRALSWGMRTVEGKIYTKEEEINESIAFENFSTHPSIDSPHLSSLTLVNQSLSIGKKGKEIKKLQEALSELGIYSDEPSGIFDKKTENAVFTFQKNVKIVNKKSDEGAGIFGPKTKVAIVKAIIVKQEKAKILTNILFPIGIKKGEEGREVARLQIFLADLGFFQGTITGIFGPITEKAVISFQLSNQIISSEKEEGAGFIGPKTQNTISKTINNKIARASIPITEKAVIGSIEKRKEEHTPRTPVKIEKMEVVESVVPRKTPIQRDEKIKDIASELRK